MKATFDTHAISKAFKLVSQVLNNKSKKVIDKFILLKAAKRGTKLVAVNVEDGYCIATEVRGVNAEEPGDVLINSAMFQKWIAEANDQEITIQGDENNVNVRGQFSDFDMSTEDPASYPASMHHDGEKHAVIPSKELKWMLKRTAFAAAVESARYALTGVMFEIHAESFRTVATNGKHMSIVTSKPSSVENGFSTGGNSPVVPTKAIHVLVSMLSDTDEPVIVAITMNYAYFRIGKTELYTRLVEGRYPTYQEVIPRKKGEQIPLMCGPTISILRQANVMCTEDAKGVEFKLAKGTLTASTKVPNTGRAKIQLPVAYMGKPLTFIIDPMLLVQFLGTHAPDEEITMNVPENMTTILCESPKRQYVIVPLTKGDVR